jgi:hypothetical protein
MKEKDVFQELDELHAKKLQRIEKLADAVVAELHKQCSLNLSSLRKVIVELRGILSEAKGLLRAAKQAQSRRSN